MKQLITALLLTLCIAACQPKDGEPSATLTLNDGVRTQTTSTITEDGALPPINMSATIENLHSGDKIQRIWIEVELSYKENGRNDLSHFVQDLQRVVKQRFDVAFPAALGGNWSMTAYATIKPKSGKAFTIKDPTPYTASINAAQPPKQKIRDYTKNPLLDVILYQRSRFTQFDAAGKPLFAAGGAGLYRMAQPTPEQLWNWKKNADAGAADMAIRHDSAARRPAALRAADPQFKGLPDFTEAELRSETLQSYGTGSYFEPKQSGIPRRWKWVPVTNNDNFARQCEAILKAVAGGQPPAGWN